MWPEGDQPNEQPNAVSIQPRKCSAIFISCSIVIVKGKGKTRMIAEKVLTANGGFSMVYSFGNFDPARETLFLQIQVEGMRKPLEITLTWLCLLKWWVGDFVSMQDGLAKVISICCYTTKEALLLHWLLLVTLLWTVSRLQTSFPIRTLNKFCPTWTTLLVDNCLHTLPHPLWTGWLRKWNVWWSHQLLQVMWLPVLHTLECIYQHWKMLMYVITAVLEYYAWKTQHTRRNVYKNFILLSKSTLNNQHGCWIWKWIYLQHRFSCVRSLMHPFVPSTVSVLGVRKIPT